MSSASGACGASLVRHPRPALIACLILSSLFGRAVLARPPAGREPKGRTYVLEAGYYEEIIIDDGEHWLGAYERAGGALQLAPCVVRVSRVKNPEEDTYPDQVKRIATEPAGKTLFLVKGNPRLHPGALVTAYREPESGGDPFVDKGRVDVRVGDVPISLIAGSRTESDGGREDTVSISDGKRTRELASCSFKDMVHPVWVGDLDGDGKADVLVKTELHNYHMELALFLSSAVTRAEASRGSLVHRVARFDGRKLQ